ncbi:hypothetical protein PH562_17295 [Rhizobium sp. CNPSo 4062]|uniref:hypothetical protein n=1 Tax=Rhizobium sp. CNPSo 4062 TaxID=3021410 RepID=UPI000DE08EFA|nr:hypothetical protein [Rhizobium sp. CNPSo 4062]MDK4704009.1 hypothetical protein [Rhizobium sp. CNPSo 4062]
MVLTRVNPMVRSLRLWPAPYSINPETVSNLDKAQQNAQTFAREVLRRILPYSGRVTAQAKTDGYKLSA